MYYNDVSNYVRKRERSPNVMKFNLFSQQIYTVALKDPMFN